MKKKKEKIEKKLGKCENSLKKFRIGERIIVVYVQEGKRISYYIGNLLKEKNLFLSRRVDRSFQKFRKGSPNLLYVERIGEWLSG